MRLDATYRPSSCSTCPASASLGGVACGLCLTRSRSASCLRHQRTHRTGLWPLRRVAAHRGVAPGVGGRHRRVCDPARDAPGAVPDVYVPGLGSSSGLSYKQGLSLTRGSMFVQHWEGGVRRRSNWRSMAWAPVPCSRLTLQKVQRASLGCPAPCAPLDIASVVAPHVVFTLYVELTR